MCVVGRLAAYLCGQHGALPWWAQGLLMLVATVVVTVLVWLAVQLGQSLWYAGF